MKDLLKIKLKTGRLLLEPISLEYAEIIFREFTDEIAIHMFPQSPAEIAETQDFINKSLKEMKSGSNLQFVVLLGDSKEFLGCAGLHDLNKKNPELGIWLKKSAHGNKYGQEAIAAIKKWADENLDYDYLKYPVVVDNIASRKIPERLGGVVIQEFEGKNAKGKPMREVEYRIYR
ncbi:MAG: GNAT family N-acetyltransferase [Parcubacteria group bacterium]|jgi:RimJ/RimL family protein N-acetyltransferase